MAKPLMVGDATFDADKLENIRQIDALWDRAYVPGYSELKSENEVRVAKGQKPIPIPRLHWVRVVRPDGREVDMRDMLEYARMGYQFCTKEDLDKYDFGLPPASFVTSEGRIRREDTELCIVGWDQAEQNRSRQRQLNSEFHGRPEDSGIEVETEKSGHGTLSEALEALDKTK